MRMETNTERYDGFEQIFDGVQECPVDTEYTLPDYCADIQKILKCIVTPEVTSVSAAGDSLTIDGCVSMHVLYLDAKGGCVRGFDTKKEFVLFFPADRRRWIGRLIKERTVCMGNTYRLHIQCFPALRISSVQFRKIFVNCTDPHQWIGRKMFQPRKKIV